MPRSRVLTVRTVESIKSGSKRQEIPDGLLPGLYLLIQPSGARSWAVRYRRGGRSRKYTLPPCDLKTARALARDALRAVAEGKDPALEKAQARTIQPDTVETVVRQFVERHCLRHTRPSTAAVTQGLLNQYVLPRWRNRLLRDIGRRDVRDLLDRIVDAGKPVAANRVLSAFRKLCNWALERDIINASPCAGVKPPSAEHSRDRHLSDEELGNLWQAAGRLGYPHGPFIMLLVLTGQRRSEVAGMRWSELDAKGDLWVLPSSRTKNAREHSVPLSQAARDILADLPRISDSDFVFTVNGTVPVNGFAKVKREIDSFLPSSTVPFRLHDIRRSVASGLARLGVNLPVIEKLLNHQSGSFRGIVNVYQKYTFAAEKRAAVEAWGRHVLDVLALVQPTQA